MRRRSKFSTISYDGGFINFFSAGRLLRTVKGQGLGDPQRRKKVPEETLLQTPLTAVRRMRGENIIVHDTNLITHSVLVLIFKHQISFLFRSAKKKRSRSSSSSSDSEDEKSKKEKSRKERKTARSKDKGSKKSKKRSKRESSSEDSSSDSD